MMFNRDTSKKIRKTHRYLGLFLGIQFLFWTLSGLYFSWTDIDEIHGDHYKNLEYQPMAFDSLLSPTSLGLKKAIRTIEIRDIQKEPYYFINKTSLYHARTGEKKKEITQNEAVYVARNHLKKELQISSIEKITATGKHHEYRKKLLPAYVISYKTTNNVKAYVSLIDGKFQTVRHRGWRWFDFLWMTHVMDYEGRDDFNTFILRAFSLLGLITVLSGFLLWFTSSSFILKFQKNNSKTNKNEKY